MSDEEIVVVVNERNQITGSTTRAQMRKERLIHRATYIFVFNSAGELFVQERTLGKDMYPGYHDLAAGGVVQHGESYEESAKREVEEELGIAGAPLERHFDFYYHDDANRVWGRVYRCQYDGPMRLQPEEVASGRFVSVADVMAGRVARVTPDSLHAFRKYVEGLGA